MPICWRLERAYSHWALSSSQRACTQKRVWCKWKSLLGRPGRSLHPPTSGFAAVVICAEPRLRWFNARFTSFISAEVAWPNTTMFAPALMYRPPALRPRRARTWQRTRGARNRTFPFPSLLSSLQCQSYCSNLVKLRYASPRLQARPLVL
jgi:hypothetical protein